MNGPQYQLVGLGRLHNVQAGEFGAIEFDEIVACGVQIGHGFEHAGLVFVGVLGVLIA